MDTGKHDKLGLTHDDDRKDDKKGAAGATAGALAGGAAGAAIGTAVPGVGNVVGAVVGGLVGGAVGAFGGKAIADHIDPKAEDAYWRTNHQSRPYSAGHDYDSDLAPAYRYGWESRGRYGQGARFDDVHGDLERGWESSRGNSRLGWDKARHASRDAWDRIERALPGDADRDGK